MQDVDNLYDFPADHVGRRTYVSVAGHVRSVPKYKTYKGSDSRNHLLPQYGGEPFEETTGPYYMPDKQPYQSPMDGSYITSRPAHQEHMRKHGVMEAGDIPLDLSHRNRDTHRPVTGREIADVIRELGGR
jgi:hypothetical protein